MHEELHFSGSPLDVYLAECGGELAGTGIAPFRAGPASGLDPTPRGIKSLARSPSASVALAREAREAIAKVFIEHGLLEEELAATEPLEHNRRHARLRRATCGACFLSLFGVLRVAPQSASSNISPTGRTNLSRYLWCAGLAACSAWLSSEAFLGFHRFRRLWSLRARALHTSKILFQFWEVAHFAVDVAWQEERAKLSMPGAPITDIAWGQISTIAQGLERQFSALLGVDTNDEHCGSAGNRLIPHAAALRSTFRCLWELQTQVLLQVMVLIDARRPNPALRILNTLRTCVDPMRGILGEVVRFQHCQLAAHEAQRLPPPRPRSLGGGAADATSIHNACCLALAHAGVGAAERGDQPSAQDVLRWLDSLAPYIDDATRACGPQCAGGFVKSRNGQTQDDRHGGNMEQGRNIEVGEQKDEDVAGLTAGAVSAEGDGTAVAPSTLDDVTLLHEGEGSPPEADTARTKEGLRFDDDGEACRTQEGRRFWRACSSELQCIFEAKQRRSASAGGSGGRSGAERGAAPAWEAWGTGPSYVAPPRAAQPRMQLDPVALALQEALEARLSFRQPGAASAEVTLGDDASLEAEGSMVDSQDDVAEGVLTM